MSDRTIHAKTKDGICVVRYERAGKWFIEGLGDDGKSRNPLSMGDAVNIAREIAAEPGGRVYLDMPGGKLFDAKYRKATNA